MTMTMMVCSRNELKSRPLQECTNKHTTGRETAWGRDIDDFILMRSMCLSLWMRKSYASASVCEEKQKQKQKKDPEKWFSISIHVKLKVHFCDSIVTIHLFHYNMLASTSFCLWINKWMCWKSFFPKAVASPLHEHTMHRLLNESNCSFHLNKTKRDTR